MSDDPHPSEITADDDRQLRELGALLKRVKSDDLNKVATIENVDYIAQTPFPGSSGDFYERIQVLKADIELLTQQRDKALEERAEWMQKTTEARQEIARLKEGKSDPSA